LIYDQKDLFNMILNLSQALAEHEHGEETVKEAMNEAVSFYGERWVLMFANAHHPYGGLVKWYQVRLKDKPKVARLEAVN